jgi:hypothetical protein
MTNLTPRPPRLAASRTPPPLSGLKHGPTFAILQSRARYPSGKGEVCKTFIRGFDSHPRLHQIHNLNLVSIVMGGPCLGYEAFNSVKYQTTRKDSPSQSATAKQLLTLGDAEWELDRSFIAGSLAWRQILKRLESSNIEYWR